MGTSRLLAAAALFLFSFTLLSASQARADGIDSYEYQVDGNTFTWELASKPTPDEVDPGYYFTFYNLSFSENGVAMVGTLDFYSNAWGGGFDLWADNEYLVANAFGSLLYSGSQWAPKMLTGTFYLTDEGYTGDPAYCSTLQVVKSVPEPSSLSLLATGLGMGLSLLFLRKR